MCGDVYFWIKFLTKTAFDVQLRHTESTELNAVKNVSMSFLCECVCGKMGKQNQVYNLNGFYYYFILLQL